MKRTTIYLYAALALTAGLAACTQNEPSSPAGGVEGAAMTFTATGLSSAGTRAPVDGDWEGVTTVAVRMDGDVKAYTVTPDATDNTRATLTSDDPHYWTGHDEATVTAWWPYNGEEDLPAVKVRADQSGDEDFRESDLIAAEEQTVTYGAPTLTFTHRTALVHIALTTYTDGLESVQLTGLSTGDGNPAAITPHAEGNDTYAALVAPQTVAAGTAFVTCTFADGKSYVYRMKDTTEWKAGEEYTYTVSLAAAKDPGYTDDGQGNYTVTSAEGLKNIAKLVNEQWNLGINITLTADIDLSGTNWTPIGIDYNHRYAGTFDGGGHTITGLTVTGSDQYAGLFGRIGSGGTVKNVTLKDVKIESNHSSGYVGGVAGDSWGTIENCSVSGSVSGTTFAGGVVGSQWGGSITGCNSSATVKGVIFAGGIAGETNSGASLTGCYATGDVTVENDGTNNSHAGGVVGYNGGGTLTACYATGNVTGTGTGTGSCYVGGVTGDNASGTLTACYHATGTVSGPDGATGGVTGRNYTSLGAPVITACYWGDNGQEQGIGYNQAGTIGGTEQVTDGNWQNAANAMNAALNAESWRYTFEPGNSLPLLVQNP